MNSYKVYKHIPYAIFILYIAPWFIFGESSYVLIHDNLDSNLTWFKTLVESKSFFADSNKAIPMYMGAPRVSFGSEFNVQLVFYYLFAPFNAYVINQIVIRVIAFAGMYLLLNKYIFRNNYKLYSMNISLLFSILPFWPSGGLSVAGLPLVVYTFANFKAGSYKNRDWVILAVVPFYSSLILSMMFLIFLLVILWVKDLLQKKVNCIYTIALLLFISLHILTNYRNFDVLLFNSDFVSQRIERVYTHKSFYESVWISLRHFLYGQYHSHSLHLIFIPLISIVVLLNLFTKNKDFFFMRLFILNIGISLWYGFWKYEGWEIIRNHINIFNVLNFSRFHFLTPLIWYVLLALSIRYIIIHIQHRSKHLVLSSILIIQMVLLFYKSDFIQTYIKTGISFKAFYANNIFEKIDKTINIDKSSYRVASIGIHPAIARYNGFYTADGYLPSFPLQYKKQFRKIISKELDKNALLKKSFDNWGSRCYIFADDVGYNFIPDKKSNKMITININPQALHALNIQYIFSSYEITNATDNSLEFSCLYKDSQAAWNIYMYHVLDNRCNGTLTSTPQ